MVATVNCGEPPEPNRGPGLDEAPGVMPLESLLASGPAEVERCCALLGSLLVATLDQAALPVAAALIETFGSLTAVLAAGASRLCRVPGMTDTAARLVEAAHVAANWAAQEQIRERDLLSNPAAVEAYIKVVLRCRPAEEAHGLFLDARNRLIRDCLLSRGIVNHTPLYPREVVRHALQFHASAVILVHNHPSGDPTPSAADIHSSRQIAHALAAVDVALHDHLIVGDNEIASLRGLGAFQ